MIYVPARFEEVIRLTICELKRKELLEHRREARKKDERTNKEKRTKKENKKKEEIKKSKRNKKAERMQAVQRYGGAVACSRQVVTDAQTLAVVLDRQRDVEVLLAGQSEPIKWLSRKVVEAADRTETPQEAYTARQIVDDVRVALSMPDVYNDLSPQTVNPLLDSVARPLNSDILMQLLYDKQLPD